MATDADKTLKVAIEGDASSVVGASEQATGAIKLTKEQTEAMSAAVAGAKKETQQFSDTTEASNKRLTEGRVLFSELNRLVPGLGEGLRAVNVLGFSPLIGTVLLLTSAFFYVKKSIDDTTKALDEAAAKAAEPEFADAIKARQEALTAAAIAAQEYADKIASIASSETTVAEALRMQLDFMAAIATARGERGNAEETLALARIAEQETSGAITPGQAAIQRGQAEKKALADEEAARQEKDRAERYTKFFAGLDAAEKAADADKRYRAAQAKIDAEREHAAGLPEVAPEKLAASKKALDEAQAQLETAQIRLADAQAFAAARGIAVPGQETLQPQLDAAEKAQAAFRLLEEQQRQYAATHGPAVETRLKAEQDAADKLKAAAEDNAKTARQLSDEISAQKKIHDAAAADEAAAAAAKRETIDLETRKATEGDIPRDVATIKNWQASKSLDAADVAKAAKALQDLDSIFNAFPDLFRYANSLGLKVRDLETAQAELKQQMGAISIHTVSQ